MVCLNMSDDNKINDVVVPLLRTIQGDIATLKESVRRIDARLGSMESLQAGFHNTMNWHSQELDEHRGRLEHLEKPETD